MQGGGVGVGVDGVTVDGGVGVDVDGVTVDGSSEPSSLCASPLVRA